MLELGNSLIATIIAVLYLVLKRVINKAMAVDPKDRYQSAEEIRRALEAVSVAMDWEESTLLNGKKWSGNDGKRDLEVTRTKMTDGQWELQVRKAGIGKLLRKDNSMCKTGMNEKKAMRETYRVLQKFVSGKA